MSERVVSVNVGHARHITGYEDLTGIDKQPVDGPVMVQAPGGDTGAGLAGDEIIDGKNHGGDTQAVYAFAREDLDDWEAELGVTLRSGMFGENLTTSGIEITNALIGERWRVGDDLVLQVTAPRIPCRTFQSWLQQKGWVKRFTAKGAPGTYLSVVSPGEMRRGDPITVVSRPGHDVTLGLTFRALTTEPGLSERVLTAGESLSPKLLATAERRARL